MRLRKSEFVKLRINGEYTDFVISKNGRVFTKDFSSERSVYVHTSGYKKVMIRINDKPKDIFLHRALYESFIEDIPKGMVINHIDGNKLNNSLENLEVCTSGDNTRHAWRIGLCTPVTNRDGSKNPTAIHSNEQAIAAYILIKHSKLKLTDIAEILHVDHGFVKNVANGLWGDITGYNEDVKKHGKVILRRNKVFTEEEEIVLWTMYSAGIKMSRIAELMHLTRNSVSNKIEYINRNKTKRDKLDDQILKPKSRKLVHNFMIRWSVTGYGFK